MKFNEYCSLSKTAYDQYRATLAQYAISFLEACFFPDVKTRAQRAEESDILITYKAVESYLQKEEEEKHALQVARPFDDSVRQVMLFIAAGLRGVEYLYLNDEAESASITVRNPLYEQDGHAYNITITNQKLGNDREQPIITVSMKVGLPTGLYDPMRAQKKRAELPESQL